MLLNYLEKNKIYQGVFSYEEKEYFCFFRLSDKKGYAINVITQQEFLLIDLKTIEYDYHVPLFKFLKKRYEILKTLDIFKVDNKSEDSLKTIHKNLHYSNILRFFKLENYEHLISKTPKQEDLNKVILKLKKYISRYIGEKDTLVYIEQIKKFKTILEILYFLPEEFLEKIKPFWFETLRYGDENFKFFKTINIPLMEKCNEFGFIAPEIYNENKHILKEKFLDLERQDDENYREKCMGVINAKLEEARKTLENELIEAKNINDEDLKMEINIIKEELDDVEKHVTEIVKNLTTEDEIITWWPEILYPVPEIIKDKNPDIPILKNMFHCYSMYS
jgi:hypothetical protein